MTSYTYFNRLQAKIASLNSPVVGFEFAQSFILFDGDLEENLFPNLTCLLEKCIK